MKHPRASSEPPPILPIERALLKIILYTLLVSGSACAGLLFYFHFREVQLKDTTQTIRWIQHNGPLPTQYLAELLDLSANEPTHYYRIDAAQMASRLQASPLISSAKIKRIKPHTLSLEYDLRTPVWMLNDLSNTGVAGDGTVIPLGPFFPSLGLPQLTLGEESKPWGGKIRPVTLKQIERLHGAFESLDLNQVCVLQHIDVSKAYASSLGEQQIVVVCQEKASDALLYVRLATRDAPHQMRLFAALYFEKLKYDSGPAPAFHVIDLRLPALAFVSSHFHD